MSVTQRRDSKSTAYVDYIISLIHKDKGVAAALRRADNPNMEYQSWEVLAAFHIDLEKPWERLPYALIAAAISKEKLEHNGKVGLGRAIASCYENGNQSDQAKAKLRRLLACNSVGEVCRVLRPLLSLINSKGGPSLDYAALLKQLLNFHWREQSVKAKWAQDFYRNALVGGDVAETKQGSL